MSMQIQRSLYSIMALSEAWLTQMEMDSSLDINGFGTPIRLDGDCEVSGKAQEGGVCFYINRRWCSNVTGREAAGTYRDP